VICCDFGVESSSLSLSDSLILPESIDGISSLWLIDLSPSLITVLLVTGRSTKPDIDLGEGKVDMADMDL
jgi:hypothetical protein